MRIYTSRYKEAPQAQSYNELRSKNTSNTKMSNFSNSKNPQNELLHLPALHTMRRSASNFSTQRNTKFKLTNLEEKVQELHADVHNCRLEAQETFSHIHFLYEKLINKQLTQTKQDLRKQVKGLERLVSGTKNAHEQRTKDLKEDCNEMWNSTQALKQLTFELRMRTDELELGMGYKNRLN